jgi:hypothetical protein
MSQETQSPVQPQTPPPAAPVPPPAPVYQTHCCPAPRSNTAWIGWVVTGVIALGALLLFAGGSGRGHHGFGGGRSIFVFFDHGHRW